MNLKLETEFSKTEILKEIDGLKEQLDELRPLPSDIEGRVMQKLRLDWNYHSNAIEGNRLSYGETVAFLMEGITAKGKPLKDHLDIRGHNEAINFLLSIVKETRPISEADIRNLHQIVLVEPYDVKAQTPEGFPTTKRITLGEYKTLPNHVKTVTGEMHYYATPEETPAKMQELMEWYADAAKNPEIHPVVTAALFHHKFVSLHPFDDGNGRLSRILMNLILMQKGFPPVIIKNDDRQNYYSLLSRADNGDLWPFAEYIVGLMKNSLTLFLKAAGGGDISEDEDIDKEIALMNLELKGNAIAKVFKSNEVIHDLLKTQIIPFSLRIDSKLKTFEESFFKVVKSLIFITEYDTPFSGVENLTHPVLLSKEIDVESWLSSINSKLETYYSVFLNLKFDHYKGPNNPFNIHCNINFIFEDYTYNLTDDNNNLIISKLYHQTLDTDDFKLIMNFFLNKFKEKI